MGIVRVISAVILLVLWLPATSHCLLEKAAVIQAGDDCCPDSSAHHSPAKAELACCSLATGLYKPGDQFVTVSAANTLLLSDAVVGDRPELSAPRAVRFSPEDQIQVHWQFVERTASAVRAPCIAS